LYEGAFVNLLNPYALAVGLLAVAMFVMHGTIFLHLKTSGALQQRVDRWMWPSYVGFIVMYVLVTVATWIFVPRATEPFAQWPLSWVVVLINVAAVVGIAVAFRRGWSGWAFIASCLTLLAFVVLLGIALFPNLVTSNPDPENSLTIYNAASSAKTLQIMLIVAVIGMPFVISYTAVIYWVFRGRVVIEGDLV
jgi:cytochrome d ubiquinol oxidase subunit II